MAYYGLGIDSPGRPQRDFRMKQAYVGGDVQVRPGGFTVFGARRRPTRTTRSKRGRIRRRRSKRSSRPRPRRGSATARPICTRRCPAASTGGRRPATRGAAGSTRSTYHNYADRDETYSFDRLDAEIVQHMPILRENWVVSLHGLVQTTLDDDDVVPYFLLPSLGSGSTLRALSELALPRSPQPAAAGRVALDPEPARRSTWRSSTTRARWRSRWDDLSLNGLKSNVGVGVRFHSPVATPLRIELAQGREGLQPRVLGQRGVLTAATRIMTTPAFASRCRTLAVIAGAVAAARRPRLAARRSGSTPTIRSRASPRRRTRRRCRSGTSICSGTSPRTCSAQPGDPTPDVKARNVNTIDEVPDSNWFTNRIVARPLSIEEAVRGPLDRRRPGARPLVDRARRRRPAFAPGFTMRDAKGRDCGSCRFDANGFPEAATGAILVANKIFWALGYWQVENHLIRVRPERARSSTTAPRSRRRPASARPMKSSDVEEVLRRAHRSADGTYRAVAARAVPGRRSAASATTARVPTIPTTSCRTSTGASCAR